MWTWFWKTFFSSCVSMKNSYVNNDKKGIRGGISHSIYWDSKANKKYMKNYDKNKELSLINVGMIIIYMDEQCQKSFQ